MQTWYVVVSLVVAGVIVALLVRRYGAGTCGMKEGFIILGSLGSYRDELHRCISDCEREDPTSFMDSTKGSLYCEMGCYSALTEKSREELPYRTDLENPFVDVFEPYLLSRRSRPRERPVSKFTPIHSDAPLGWYRAPKMEQVWSENNNEREADEACFSEVRAKCSQECAYSDTQTCPSECFAVTVPNCALGGWNWK